MKKKLLALLIISGFCISNGINAAADAGAKDGTTGSGSGGAKAPFAAAGAGGGGEDPFNFGLRYVAPSKSNYSNAHAQTLVVTCVDYRFPDEIFRFMESIGQRDEYDVVVLPGASLAIAGTEVKAKAGPDKDIPLPPLNWGTAAQTSMLACKALHDSINKIIILDHENCGAYKGVHGEEGNGGTMPKDSHAAPACTLVKARASFSPTPGATLGTAEGISHPPSLHYHLLDGPEKAAHLDQMQKAIDKIRGYSVPRTDTGSWSPFTETPIYAYMMHTDGLVENWTGLLDQKLPTAAEAGTSGT